LAAELHNLYGPTEAAVDVTAFRVTADLGTCATVPIGRPIGNTTVHVLDSLLRPVPANVPGELFLGGPQLSPGYLNRPALTAATFVPDPFHPGQRLYRTGDLARRLPDGAIEFLGRSDHQVKVRGNRIELGEIEATLQAHPDIRAAFVTDHRAADEVRLVAYLVPARMDKAINQAQMRAWLRTHLPEHMIPAFYVAIAAAPLTPSGKLDRSALPRPDINSRQSLDTMYVAPRTKLESLLADIWGEVLDRGKIGVDDNFFALGGDSVRVIRVIAKARDRGVAISVGDIFLHQTVRALAQHGEQVSPGPTEESEQRFSLLSDEDRARLALLRKPARKQ
jgi:aryl carrier-like protein